MNGRISDPSLINTILRKILVSLLMTVCFAPAVTASELVILYSNDIRGETEPCG